MSTHELPVKTKRTSWIRKRPSSSAGHATSAPDSQLVVHPLGGAEGEQSNDYVQGAPLSRAATADSATTKRWSNALLNGTKVFSSSSTQSSDTPNHNELGRTKSSQTQASTAPEMRVPDIAKSASGSFARMSLSSVMGGLSSISLSRTSTNTSIDDREKEKERDKDKDKDKERGRPISPIQSGRSHSQAPPHSDPPSRSQSRARSQSPFSLRRFRNRDPSPAPSAIPLAQSDVESDASSVHASIHPRNAFTDHDSDDETIYDGETEDEDWSADEDIDGFDQETERNTEANAFTDPTSADGVEPELDIDPLGEGVNVVLPPEPYFPTTLNASTAPRGRRIKRKKSVRHHEPLPLKTSRPHFQRDRCTITLTQGDPEGKLEGRKKKMYVVGSDLSEESRYAVEWGIGTVLRDGDEMLIVTVVENDARVDPATPNTADRTGKLRSQQERQGLAYILVRQATSLLQRTTLNVTIACQAWHAKNARHMLLDIVDYNEPVMLIVGSRGLGQLKNILLGSTSHYLIQKCSVPVMVARRRLKRPPRKSAHLAKHRAHVSLAEAGIDRVAARVDEDIRAMRETIQRDDETRERNNVAIAEGGPATLDEAQMDEDEGSVSEEEGREGIKVAGK
ncbi:hypothetical protein E1B28_012489 [Marasmius oreades]|uniref:UspA domain-containing protein n=1 Tax=Marasmius oreades TaxID=181124 RepID=A0A9P7UNA5_9AGAR|nr:uncharacterized protein E1B28_012489 [Marasmius oreades]KAG7088502.1 hypothetical protein E1B28_012489 [Marasmius oreades]